MKLHWSDLSAEEQQLFEKEVANGCGPEWSPALRSFLRKYFFAHLFHAKCVQHDFYYVRGGDWKDRLKADWDMTKFVFIDFFQALLFLLVGSVYLLSVVLFGWINFQWGEYKTKEEILTYLLTK